MVHTSLSRITTVHAMTVVFACIAVLEQLMAHPDLKTKPCDGGHFTLFLDLVEHSDILVKFTESNHDDSAYHIFVMAHPDLKTKPCDGGHCTLFLELVEHSDVLVEFTESNHNDGAHHIFVFNHNGARHDGARIDDLVEHRIVFKLFTENPD